MQPRLIDLKTLQSYVGLGEKNAAQLGREAGAVVRYGTRVLYDRTEIDRYIDQMKEASANGRTDYSI
mgnify:FL=1